MNPSYQHLADPIQIGAMHLRNRVFFPGHGTGLPVNNVPSDAHIAYLRKRAQGGVSLIVTEIAQVEERAIYSAQALRIVSDSQIAAYSKLAKAIHAEDSRVLVQLFHPGREMHLQPDGRRAVAWAPSEIPSDANHVMPRPMSKFDIQQTIQQFAVAAKRLERAGIDGVEIVATHGFLPSQFLNTHTNERTDEYGGSFENRLRFLSELLDAIQDVTTSHFVVGLRICTNEGFDRGLDVETSLNACIALDRANLVDYFSLTYGTVSDHGGAVDMIAPMGGEHPRVEAESKRFCDSLNKPVLVAGRINQMRYAASLIEDGAADMVGLARANICDPEITNKTLDGKVEDIRVCIGCNQACIGHRHTGAPISCIQNPVTGRELNLEHLKLTERPKHVLVAGGGPGGMKAAAVAAARGHRVTLCERAAELGGQVKLAERLPYRSEFGGIVANLKREMSNSGVDVRMNAEVDVALVERLKPDVVILATGAKPYAAKVEREGNTHVVDAWSVIRGEANVGASVVVADWASDWIGLGVAEMLARDGCHVRLAVNGRMAGEQLHAYTRDSAVGRLYDLGVEVIPNASLFGVVDRTVIFQHAASHRPIEINDADTVVTALGHIGVRELEFELSGLGIETIPVGDCQAPRTAEEAILEGMEAALAI